MSLPLSSCSRVAAKSAAAEAVPVRAVAAESRDVPLEISAVGNVEAMESVEVKSRIAGQVTRVAFEQGQNVARGQLLFAIDPEVVRRQAAEQQAQLDRDSAMEQQARAVVARDAASEKQSQSEAEIAAKLGTLGVLSEQRVNELVTSSDAARSSLRSDQAAVDAAVAAAKADRARISETQLQLSFTEVVAPISGRAGAVLVKAGNMVRDNDTTLVSLVQLAPVYVTFGIPEQSLAEVQRISAGGQMTVGAIIGDGPAVEGRLVFIDNTVDTSTGAIRLKAVFPNSDHLLWPGQFVDVRLRLRVDRARIVVPESAVQDGLDGKFIWLAQSGIASVAPVTVVRTFKPQSGPEEAIVGSGIKPGDLVITEGQLRLTAGARISLLNAPAARSQQLGGVQGAMSFD